MDCSGIDHRAFVMHTSGTRQAGLMDA